MKWLVSFRSGGVSVDPSAISTLLKMPATYAHRKGDVKIFRSRSGEAVTRGEWDSNMWLLESALSSTDSLEKHLQALLRILSSRGSELRSLMEQGMICDVACGLRFSSESMDAGFSLTSAMITDLANLGLDIHFNIYAV